RTKNSPLSRPNGHIVCFAVIDIKVSKNYGTNWIFGSKKTSSSGFALLDPVALSLRSGRLTGI
ncbi:MAG: hypothetical protein QME12_07600, partial [Nanoarchaeota archaeon]|nr:hypothetical protein [Nanoarchaeota archaeon]